MNGLCLRHTIVDGDNTLQDYLEIKVLSIFFRPRYIFYCLWENMLSTVLLKNMKSAETGPNRPILPKICNPQSGEYLVT